MAKRTLITEKGMELLASSSQVTGQYWWIGYYGLAYVPNSWKESPVSIPDEEDRCNVVNSDRDDDANWIETTDSDEIVPSMTRLTKYGDMIYNIFQGDLVGTGYYNCVSDGSSGGDLFGLTMYNSNIKKHYRYVLNEYDNNTLVTWVDLPEDTTEGLMVGKYVYLGTDGFVKSDMAIPAPLYYIGDTGNDSVDNYFPDFIDEEINGSNIYPYIEELGLKTDGTTKINVPKVTVDYREYLDSRGNTETMVYGATANPTNDGSGNPRDAGGQYFDSLEITSDVDSNFDNTSWYAANLTMLADYEALVDSTLCKEFWKLHSISNYNKYHAPVGSTGHVLSSDLSNRNMAKVTKFFPISNYKVITTESGNNTSGNAVEFATGISISIDLDLAPRTKAQGYDGGDFDETASLTFFDKYDLSETEYAPNQIEQSYYAGGADQVIEDQLGKNIFNTTHTSFKFNRIGLYAVSLRKCPFVKNVSDPTGKDVTIQFEINPDIEPVLFAVVDWDNTVHLDDTGDGIHQFRADINLNIESPTGNLDADGLVRDSTIFYNMYEDDAIKWYQNQLIATASTQNAITELEIKIGHIEKKVENALNTCTPTDLNKKYSSKDHNHPFEGLRHLFDGIASGSLRSVNTAIETSTIESEIYLIGINSVVLGGENNYVHDSDYSSVLGGTINKIISADYSVISGGFTNEIGASATHAVISGGASNNIGASATHSVISGGFTNTILENSTSSVISGGYSNIITGVAYSVISGGYQNAVAGTYSVISGGKSHQIWSDYSIISGGFTNKIMADATYAVISGGTLNDIGANATHAVISGGGDNNILGSAAYSVISGGATNNIGVSATHAVISGGFSNIINGVAYSVISGGYANAIAGTYSVISGGKSHQIWSDYSVISGGATNNIMADATYAVISGGTLNDIDASATHAVISGGGDNNIGDSATHAVISGGATNNIGASATHAVISGGFSNIINGVAYSVISGGYANAIAGTYSVISGGKSHQIWSDYSVISGGATNNIMADATYAVILGGSNNSTSAPYSVVSGEEAVAFGYGEVTHAVGKFSTAGDAQFSRLIFKGTTTDATIAYLTLGDGSEYNIVDNHPGKVQSVAGRAIFHGQGVAGASIIITYDFLVYEYISGWDIIENQISYKNINISVTPSLTTMYIEPTTGVLSPKIELDGFTGSVNWLVTVEMTTIVNYP